MSEPAGNHSGWVDQVGKGNAGAADEVSRKPTPMGHHPLLRQSMR